jgi:hypothetical protein
MRKYTFWGLLFLAVPAFANSVQVGSMTYMGHGTFQVNFTQAFIVFNFTGFDMINGGGSAALPSSHTFQAGVHQQFCPCFSAGFDLTYSDRPQLLADASRIGKQDDLWERRTTRC